MSDLMSKGELFNKLATVQTLGEAYGVIQEMPTVDAVPAIHGKWQVNRLDDAYYVCTVCKKVTRIPRYVGGMLYAYCPHCGALMDGKGNGNETD